MRLKWKNALIVKLLERKIGVGFMKKRLEVMWAKAGNITVADLGHYLATRKWEPCFDPDKANIHKVAARIRLPGILQEYCEFSFLNHLGSVIGKVIKVDRTTSTVDRARFARVCFEIDLSKPLRGEYVLDGARKRVEYEGLFLICLKCGRYEHNSDSCPDFARPTHVHQPEEAPAQLVENSGAQGVGPWMVVNRRKKDQPSYQKHDTESYRTFGADISNKKSMMGPKSGANKEKGNAKGANVQQSVSDSPSPMVNNENVSSCSKAGSPVLGMLFATVASSAAKKVVQIVRGFILPRNMW
ncbi:uncharacterized protein LOC133311080 [Gastrolobium bilobum]|uniref:uncharacterized protein LOC133311080 n=1 Tax=Gastrolobium bilobum TaxID=150636 RepID=UPI002AB0A1C1|nr:uncharacterized protein LOC133311080 [Gastrolobium bilobum]